MDNLVDANTYSYKKITQTENTGLWTKMSLYWESMKAIFLSLTTYFCKYQPELVKNINNVINFYFQLSQYLAVVSVKN